MKITNKHNLPEPLVKAVTWGNKPRKGFSVTDLISPPRITQLTRRHWGEIEEDASERIWVLLGSAIHYVLEKGEVPESLREEALSAEVNGVKITGRPDLWHNRKIDDYKVTSVWTVVYSPEGRKEWEAQLNIYRYLYKVNGFGSDKLEITAILRDWQERKVGDNGYPQIPVVMIDIPIWPDLYLEAYLKGRITGHIEAQNMPDDDLPLCTPEDMWERPTRYAVMKPNRKTAVKLYDSLEEARAVLDTTNYIQERLGERIRCKRYCSINKWCNQYTD